MVKINRLHILLIFLLFSVLVFFIIKSILTGQLITTASQNDLYGNVFVLMPFSIGLSIVAVTMISGAGALIIKKKKNIEIHTGFIYSFIFSLASLLTYIIFLVYIFIGSPK